LATSAVNVPISRGTLLSHLIVNTANGTANYRILSAFRLKSIEIWGSTGTLGTTTTASVEWLSENGPSTVISDTSVGTAQPLYVRTSPPANSLASFWSVQGNDESTVVMTIIAPANSVIDITYEVVLRDGEASVLVTTAATGAIGQVYMTYLDGVSSGLLQPVSYTSLT